MRLFDYSRPILLTLMFVHACGSSVLAAEVGPIVQEEIIIDAGDGTAETPGAAGEIVIDQGMPDTGEVIIDGAATGEATIDTTPGSGQAEDIGQETWDIRVDRLWAEYAHFGDSDSATENAWYGNASAVFNWQPNLAWELQLAGRIDGYSEDDLDSFSTIRGDYGDSYVRYRGDGFRLTLGTQTVIWGRLDGLPPSDRVSTTDLSRFVLDDLEDRRRSNPMFRAETAIGGGKLDVVWLVDFRAAEMPDKDSVWHPVDTRRGRVLGIDPDDVPPALVKGASVSEEAPDGDGGFGMRYTRTHSFADFGVTLANTRQSIPYFRAAGPGRIEAAYPRSWAYGVDAATEAAGATWRAEVLYSSDNPVTRTDMTYTTTPALIWGGGVEFHPGDGDTRVNLQLVGMNLIDAPAVIDRTEVYSVNGEVEVPFDRARWRLKLDYYIGLDDRDIYLNPEIAFLGWEPHELYLGVHYFDGDEQTFGGFHEDHSSVNLGWRAKF